MKKLTTLTVIALAFTMIAGAAWAWDIEDHVIMAPNGKGDFLIYPVYIAAQGYQTTFWVTNTSNLYSTVAKVVFRSARYSQETRDFFVFLSPNDVAKIVVKQTAEGAEIISEDDSVISDVLTDEFGEQDVIWGNESPFEISVGKHPCEQSPMLTQTGYITVYEVAWQDYSEYEDADGTVPKGIILSGFGGINGLTDEAVNPDPDFPMYRTIPEDGSTIPGMWVGTLNLLAGHMEIGLPASSLGATLRPTVLRNYDTSLRSKQTINRETYPGGPDAHNLTGEVEAALSRNELHMPFGGTGLSFHFITFPTKLAILDRSCPADEIEFLRSPYFNDLLDDSTNVDNSETCVLYNADIYDLSEHSAREAAGGGRFVSPIPEEAPAPTLSFCEEVNFRSPSSPLPASFTSSEGWIRYTLAVPDQGFTDANCAFAANAVEPCISYDGVPVIGTVLDFQSGSTGMGLMEAAYDDGTVWDLLSGNATDPIIYYYQYWESVHFPWVFDDFDQENFGYRGTNLPVFEDTAPWPARGAKINDGNFPASLP